VIHVISYCPVIKLSSGQTDVYRTCGTTRKTLRHFSNILPPPSVWPHLFCGAGHEKRRGEQLKWSLAFRLYIGSFVFHVHSYQDQFIQPGLAECVLFSLDLHFVCLYCFNLFVCPHPFVFPGAVESSPLQVLALA